jgi:PilZ domain.
MFGRFLVSYCFFLVKPCKIKSGCGVIARLLPTENFLGFLPMSISQRRFIRFSLDIPAIRQNSRGERKETLLQQISIGGCLTVPDEDIFTGDEFRLEIMLPNGNNLPLRCRALYKFPGKGIGVKFLDITQFEQQLLAEIISENLEKEGLPLQVDPFAHPPVFIEKENSDLKQTLPSEEMPGDRRRCEEAIVEEILSLDN